MQKIKEAIIVEGRYDRQKLTKLFGAVIIDTGGFSIFNNSAKIKLIKSLAKKTGIIIFTDSDSAGMLIRNYISGQIEKKYIKHAYIPAVKGKEKRKISPSKEGFLGVEGIEDSVILEAVKKAVPLETIKKEKEITKAILYEDGFYGRSDSRERRNNLMKTIDLPPYLSVNAFVKILNAYYSFDEYKKISEK